MASPELQRLWKLAQVDNAIEAIKRRAAALDPGKSIAAELKSLEQEESSASAEAKALRAELSDLELKQKGIDDKLKKIDKDMYGGSVVNAREVENLEKEVAALKRQRGSFDERILELLELVPPAESKQARLAESIEKKRTDLAAKRKEAIALKESMEQEYRKLGAARPDIAKAVANPTLLARYDAIRQRHGGIGMAEITKKTSCSACGTMLPERTIQLLKDDKIATCESCHRLLYYTEGII